MEKKENICRLCLKFEDTAFYPLDESSREKLEVVIPDMDLDIPSNFEICSSCTESLDSAYDFKENVQENEKVILDKIEGLGDEKLDLKDVLGAATANGDDGDGKKDVCRTCLKTCTAEDNPTSVGEEEPDSLVNTMLNVCLSNVDLQITINPVLCESCVSTLREIYGFVSRALAVDKKITAHRASNGAVDMNTILKEEKSNFFSEFEIQDEDNGPDNYDDLKILDENDKKIQKRKSTETAAPPAKIPRRTEKQALSNRQCNRCGKTGHHQGTCRTKRECYSCGECGHNSRDCPVKFTEEVLLKRRCYTCDRQGHYSKDCPVKFTEEVLSKRRCYSCNQTGHNSKDCPVKFSEAVLARRRCYTCDEEGHSSKNCPNKFTKEVLSKRRCYACNEVGHESKDCPGSSRSEAARRQCYTCREWGHESRNCPEKFSETSHCSRAYEAEDCPKNFGARTFNVRQERECYACGGSGHEARNCPRRNASAASFNYS